MLTAMSAYWDTRKGAFPVDTSAVDKSHHDPVYSVAWVSSKTGAHRNNCIGSILTSCRLRVLLCFYRWTSIMVGYTEVVRANRKLDVRS